MVTIKLILLAILFVASSGSLFSSYFKHHKYLTVIASIMALVSSYYLINTIYSDIKNESSLEQSKDLIENSNQSSSLKPYFKSPTSTPKPVPQKPETKKAKTIPKKPPTLSQEKIDTIWESANFQNNIMKGIKYPTALDRARENKRKAKAALKAAGMWSESNDREVCEKAPTLSQEKIDTIRETEPGMGGYSDSEIRTLQAAPYLWGPNSKCKNQ